MRRALVLGSGAVAGALWQAGMVEGLRRAGTDLGAADLVTGCSAGAYVAALLAHGADLPRVVADLAAARPPHEDSGQVDRLARLYDTLGVLADDSFPPGERRRRVGAAAVRADTADGTARINGLIDRLPARDWPDRPLLLPAVDVASGDRVVWRRGGAAPFEPALRAAVATPTMFPPVEIAGRRYMDGAVYSHTHADLAAGHERVVVLAPMRQLQSDAGSAAATVVGPDAEAAEVFDIELFDQFPGMASYEAGLRQAAVQAPAVARAWSGS
ncbi:patatin-like phospholipase family protein [Actinomadura rayongensis]|uniref:Patatin-like phospholipase family protein n=1 Tax=Actinomadura rayongensis TaxID=1429076 RepID=A0A6I4W6J3_9ACTN|nr:patatin-like phospholipase family protein [Actinomadura rayongensis]